MDGGPLCSVVIPSYNNAEYVPACLESVLAQTYPKLEVVVVDDASAGRANDETYRKFEKDPRLRVYRNDRNRGISYTKRRCVELAAGELCTILDCDDTITPEAVATLVDAHRRKPAASLICSRRNWCDSDLKARFSDDWDYEGSEVEFTMPHEHVRVSHLCMFKMASYRQTEGIDPELPIAEDHDMFLKLGEVGEVWHIKDVLHNYRVHDGGMSMNERKHWARYWSVMVVMRACERRGLDPAVEVPKTFAEDEERWLREIQRVRLGYEGSYSYRLGRLMLSPLRALKRLR